MNVAGAAASYTTAYALNKAMGREAHFSLRELGANMAAAYLSSELMGGEPVANNDGTTTTTAAAQVRPFEWSNVLVDVMQNVAHSGIQYFVSKAFNVKDTHWDGKFALASAAASAGSGDRSGITARSNHSRRSKPISPRHAARSQRSGSVKMRSTCGLLASAAADHLPQAKVIVASGYAASSTASSGVVISTSPRQQRRNTTMRRGAATCRGRRTAKSGRKA